MPGALFSSRNLSVGGNFAESLFPLADISAKVSLELLPVQLSACDSFIDDEVIVDDRAVPLFEDDVVDVDRVTVVVVAFALCMLSRHHCR